MTTPIANIDNTTLLNLTPNLDIGDVADPALRLAYFQYLNVYIQNIVTAYNAFITSEAVTAAQKGAANGVVPLDASSKINELYLPDSVLGQLEYQGTYNATSNVPTLPTASAAKGWYYVISAEGTVSGTVYSVGDWIVSNGTAWEKIDNTDAVATVFGRMGNIVATTNDYTWAQINKATSSLADINSRSASDLNAGTLNVARIPTAIPVTNIGNGDVTNAILSFLSTLNSNAQSQIDSKIATTQKGVASGVVPLNASVKIDVAYLPDSLVGQLVYQGTWNAATNTPALAAASAVKGSYYVTSVAGIYSSTDYGVGDWIVSNGTIWQKVDNTDAVATVFGRTGAIIAATNDYTFAQIDKTVSSLADLTTRSASDLTSGTLPVGRIPTAIPATSIGSGLVNNAEFDTLDGVTSAIQTQLDARAPLAHVGSGGGAHANVTTSVAGFLSAADYIYLKSLVPSGLGSYSIPSGQVLSFWSKYSQEQDPVTGELVFYEI